MTDSSSLPEYLDFAMDAGWRAGQLTLAHFQTGVAVDWKADQSPVTVADRGAEKLLRELIGRQFPEHAILGEEDYRSFRIGLFGLDKLHNVDRTVDFLAQALDRIGAT